MASAAAAAVLTFPTLLDVKPTSRRRSMGAPRSVLVGLRALPAPPHAALLRRPASCRRVQRNISVGATGEAPADVTSELPEIVQTIQEAWDKLEDKYVVTSLGVAGFVALWASVGLISAIDRLPLVPGVLELVGIGYTGWFAYRNLVFEPDREVLIEKVKCTYSEIIGSS